MGTEESSGTPDAGYYHCPSCGRPTTEALDRCRHCKAVLRPEVSAEGTKADDGFAARVFGVQGTKGKVGCTAAALVPFLLLLGGVSYCSNQSAERARIAAEQAAVEAKAEEERYQESVRTGKVCADGANDLNTAFELNVKRDLKDPDSFEHLGTVIRPSGNGETYEALMRYRARNSFNGYVTGTAVGKLYVAERGVCEVRSFQIIE